VRVGLNDQPDVGDSNVLFRVGLRAVKELEQLGADGRRVGA
jgi:hypothetical protein